MHRFNRRKLDAVVLGADRSGSTWLRKLCIQHPNVYVCPVWQREFLSKQAVARHRRYWPMKFKCPMGQYRGEKVVLGIRNFKLYHGSKVARMYNSHNKNMKFVLSVRNPIDRTFSQFVARMVVQKERGARFNFDVNNDLAWDSPQVIQTMFYTLLEPYLGLYPKENFFIYPMELMKKDTVHWLNKVFDFLGVEQDIALQDEDKLANPGKYDRAEFVPMSENSKQHLVRLCIGEMEKMSELSGVDLIDLWKLKQYL